MKTILLSLLVLVFFIPEKDKSITVCHGGEQALMEFAAFGKSEEFLREHENPTPFALENKMGEKITFSTPDGKSANAYFIKARKKTNKYLFVFHEWYGLNDYVKNESQKYFKELGDINVLAIDLYDGKVADNRQDASAYMQAMQYSRGEAIIQGALDFAGKDAEIATIGWCFGGGWSLQGSLIAGKHAKACVIYYGMPEKDVERLKTLNCDVLGIFASREKWITPEVVNQFEADMKSAGKNVEIHSFDAEHAFANPSNPQYDSDATKKAYEYTIRFLNEKM